MDDGRAPASLGDRLNVVALVCGVAASLVLTSNLVFAVTTAVPGGAAASPVRQRLLQAARPADVALAVVVLVGAAALALGRWLDGEQAPISDAVGTLVVASAAAVTVLAVVGMFADILWRLDGSVWGWYIASVGERTAAAGLGAVAVWLGRSGGGGTV